MHLRWRCKSWCFVGVARASCCSLSSSGLRAHSSIALLHRKHDSFPSVWGVPQHASTLHNLLSRGPIHGLHGPMDNVSFTLGHPNCFVHNTCQSNVYMLRARECVHNFLQTTVLRVGGVRGGWFCCARSIYIHTHTPPRPGSRRSSGLTHTHTRTRNCVCKNRDKGQSQDKDQSQNKIEANTKKDKINFKTKTTSKRASSSLCVDICVSFTRKSLCPQTIRAWDVSTAWWSSP